MVEKIDLRKRKFLLSVTKCCAIADVAAASYPIKKASEPSATVAEKIVDVDISDTEMGMHHTVLWRGKPIIIWRRTPEQIEEAQCMNSHLYDLQDPELDADRVVDPELLVLIAVCTHLGCVPLSDKGEHGAFFRPSHGSHFDFSGRIRRGPAPYNHEVPPYECIDETTIRIG